MDSFKPYDEIMSVDKRHLFLQKMGGKEIDLPSHHSTLEAIQMHAGVPRSSAANLILPEIWRFTRTFSTPWVQRCSSRPVM